MPPRVGKAPYMPQIKMAQRRWRSLSQIFVGPYLISRNENQGSLKNVTTDLYTTNSGLSILEERSVLILG